MDKQKPQKRRENYYEVGVRFISLRQYGQPRRVERMTFEEEMRFRRRMMKLSKEELVDRMLNMKAFIDDLVEEVGE